MKLRAQLILAIFFLGVLPLGGVIAFSYQSSLNAFRQAVETEAQGLVEEMNGRMELAVADLNQRIQGLGALPYQVFTSREAEKDDRLAGEFLAHLTAQMGESAAYLSALEFFPAPHAAPAPDGPPPPRPPSPPVVPEVSAGPPESSQSFVIQFPRHFFNDTGEGQALTYADSGAFLVEGQEGLVMIRRKMLETGEGTNLEAELTTETIELVEDLGHLVGNEEALERLALKVGEKARTFAELVEKKQQMRQEQAERNQARTIGMILPDEDLGCRVSVDGKEAGRIRARLRSRELLRSVLSRTRRDQGEIPFAADGEGHLYTPDPRDEPVLRELKDAGLVAVDGTLSGRQQTQVSDNWLVVTREAPASGIVFGIARPVGESLGEIRRVAGRNLSYGMGILALAMVGVLPLSRKMTRNLSTLTDGAQRLADGDLSAQVPVRSRDEFGALAQTFNQMAANLKENQAKLLEQERMGKELEMCRKLQAELLPRKRMQLPFAEVQAVSIPAREVGGDFFNYFSLRDGSMAFLVGDVSGKGMPAALLMANIQATLRARLSQEGDLAQLAADLDRELEESTPSETYVTLFIGILGYGGRTLRYVNAGHNVQYVVRKEGGLDRLESSGRPLGLLSGGGYVERRTNLQDGDRVVLYTDGLVEAENLGGDLFGESRLERLMAEPVPEGPDSLLVRLEQAIRQHRGGAEAADDATMLVLTVGGSAPARKS